MSSRLALTALLALPLGVACVSSSSPGSTADATDTTGTNVTDDVADVTDDATARQDSGQVVTLPGPDDLGPLEPGPCVIDSDNWECALRVAGPGYLVTGGDAGERFARGLTARWDGPDGLVDELGAPLLGYSANDDGTLGSALGPIVTPSERPPRATSRVRLAVNLDATTCTPTDGFDPSSPNNGGYNFSARVGVFDSLGSRHWVDLYFTTDGAGTWSWTAVIGAVDAGGDAGDPPVEVGSGALSFDTDGTLLDDTPSAISLAFPNAESQDVLIDFAGAPGVTTTQWGAPSVVLSNDQDGHGYGAVERVEVGWTGDLRATYSNGETVLLGWLAIALFDAPSHLAPLGGGRWTATAASGAADLAGAWASGRGGIVGWRRNGPPYVYPGATESQRTRLVVDGEGHLVLDLGGGVRGYTRAVDVHWDPLAGFVDDAGARLIGRPSIATNQLGGAVAPIPIPPIAPPVVTERVALDLNLDANAEAPYRAFDVTRVESCDCFSYTATVGVYDSLGLRHQTDLYFVTDEAGTWSWIAVVDLLEQCSSEIWPVELGSGTLSFDTDGTLLDDTPTTVSASFANAGSQDIDYDFTGTTQYGHPSSVHAVEQGGFAPGLLVEARVEPNGDVVSRYDSGQEIRRGQLVIARFGAQTTLYEVRPGVFVTTSTGATVSLGQPGVALNGEVSSEPAPADAR